ncbi:sporulation histidine kinase inhibitor Sda [Salipaludibacillus sp. CF4.18]
MTILSNQTLIDSYEKALQLQLSKEFIGLLLEELYKRELIHT